MLCFTRLCFYSKSAIFNTQIDKTHIPEWEHSIKVISDSSLGNKQEGFRSHPREGYFLGGTLVENMALVQY